MERLVIILFSIAFMLYLAAFIFYLYFFLSKKQPLGILATACTGLGLLLHAVSIVTRFYAAGYIPIGGAFEAFFLSSWFVVAIYFIVELWSDLKVLGILVMPVVVVLTGIAVTYYGRAFSLSGLLKGPWVNLHLTAIYLAYAGFLIAAGLAVLYLIQEGQLKKHKTSAIFRRLPSLKVLDDLSVRTVALAEVLFTIGMVMGIIKAVQWREPWVPYAVVGMTIVAWLVFVFYLLGRWVWGWGGKRAATVCILGFLCIVIIRLLQATLPF